jgi:cytochrome c553
MSAQMMGIRASLFKVSILAMVCGYTSPYIAAGMIDKEGMAEWEICAMCHSLNGISRMAKFPKLAGQKPAYISKQFRDFNAGRRTNDGGQMEAITTEVDMDAIEAIAHYFAQLPLPSAAQLGSDPQTVQLFNEGEKIFYQGIGTTQACANCHDRSGGREKQLIAADAPWLFGQHKAYLVKQLEDFKSANRTNDVTASMHKIATNLSPQAIEAVTVFLAHKQPGKESK